MGRVLASRGEVRYLLAVMVEQGLLCRVKLRIGMVWQLSQVKLCRCKFGCGMSRQLGNGVLRMLGHG